MSVSNYLYNRASNAVLSEDELTSIRRSIETLQSRLNTYFGSAINGHFQFGSSTRGTILPRKMDSRSDIDYMVVFSEGGYTPQTYLNRLKSFVEKGYPSSEIKQSSPTIVLELNHIKFELVPALKDGYRGGYSIPNGNSWQHTDPNDFNGVLIQKNKETNSYLKPTIRLVKFWNAQNNYVFNSYSLEKWMVGLFYWGLKNQRDYLFYIFDSLQLPQNTQSATEKVERAKKIIKEVREFEAADMSANAGSRIKSLIPE